MRLSTRPAPSRSRLHAPSRSRLHAPSRSRLHAPAGRFPALMAAVGLLLLLVLGVPAAAAPAPPLVLARGAILMDANSGEVLWEQNADTPRPMASTTKIMTALLIVENGKLDEVVTVSPKAAAVKESSLHLKPGEQLTMRDLLYGILLRSANDGCVAAAEHISGSEAAFVARMNERAAELGCTNTHFENPNGLHAEGHQTTPRDLALIAGAAMKNPTFRKIVATPAYTIERSMNKFDRRLRARDYTFLKTYPGANGIKTGYTRQAGHCFVGAARRGPFQLISVVLHSPSLFRETTGMLDWGFKNFRGGVAAKPGQNLGAVRVEGGRAAEVAATTNETVPVTVPIHASPVRADLSRLAVRAPVKAGQELGIAPLMTDGKQVGQVVVIAAQPVGISVWRIIGRFVAGLFVLLVIGVIFGAIAENSRRRRRRLKARRRGPDPRGAGARERAGRPTGTERASRR